MRGPQIHEPDQYAALDPWIGNGALETVGLNLWTWVPKEDRRRLAAYAFLGALRDGSARYYVDGQDADPDDVVAKFRQYGDPSLLVRRARSAVLGESQKVKVEGAEVPPAAPEFPKAPPLPGEPKPTDDEKPPPVGSPAPGQQAPAAAPKAPPKPGSPAGPSEPTTPPGVPPKPGEPPVPPGAQPPGVAPLDPEAQAEQQFAAEVQKYLDGWWRKSRVSTALKRQEWNSVGLGDGVLVLGVDREAERIAVRTYDPGFFFPDRSTQGDAEFPQVVHLAWEEVDRDNRTWVVRKTWELLVLADDDVRPPLPWNAEGKPPKRTCLYSSGRWEPGKLRGKDVHEFPKSAARWDRVPTAPGAEPVFVKDVDMRVDFIPVIHMAHDREGEAEWGTSLLTPICELLRDVANSDTDTQIGSELFGSSALVRKGVPDGTETSMDLRDRDFRAPKDGSVELLDNSKALTGMTGYVQWLRELLARNSRIPQAALGVDPSKVPSGIALLLGLDPLSQLSGDSRNDRQAGHDLLPKMAARMAQVEGWLPKGELPEVHVELGAFLPRDADAVVTRIRDLFTTAGDSAAISLETAVRWLRSVGLDIPDEAAELSRIQGESARRQQFEMESMKAEAAFAPKPVGPDPNRAQPQKPAVK